MEKLSDERMDRVIGGAGIDVNRLEKSGTKPSAVYQVWLCYNGHEFVSEINLCPICGMDARLKD